MLLDLWGLLRAASLRGAAGRFIAPEIVVIEVDGKLIRIAENKLDEFLDNLQAKVEKKARTLIRRGEPLPKVVVKEAPKEVVSEVRERVKEINQDISEIFRKARKMLEQDEEDALLALIL